jgi:formylglycine-generating enzyme
LCNFRSNEGGTTPVGKYSPQGDSPFGVTDMSGNVWEWTSTDYDKTKKVLCGGSWSDGAYEAMVTSRYNDFPNVRNQNIGFRCVIVLKDKDQAEEELLKARQRASEASRRARELVSALQAKS